MGTESEDTGSNTLTEPLKKWRKPDDLDETKMRMYRAVRASEQVMYDPASTRAQVLRAVHATTQAVNTYLKVLQADELEERIEALEEAIKSNNNLRRVS